MNIIRFYAKTSFWLQFNSIVQVIFSSSATVAIMIAFLLDRTHSRSHNSTRRDSGRHWWAKFRKFDSDTRSEEFYSLPYSLNRFFPSFWDVAHRSFCLATIFPYWMRWNILWIVEHYTNLVFPLPWACKLCSLVISIL